MKRKPIDSRLLNFGSHKQMPFRAIFDSQQQKYKREMQLKTLIHKWLDYESQLNPNEQSLNISKLFLSRSSNEIKQLSELQDDNEKERQKNLPFQSNPLSIELVQRLYQNHAIFKKINYNLAETLINIGVFSLYKMNQSLPYVFYSEKQKNHFHQNKRIGFIIYGKIKLFNKPNNYETIITQNDTIGEHGIQSLGINFSDFTSIKVKSFDNQTAILWISKNHYDIFLKQSIKCGLKEQLRKLESHLKLSWIKKAIKKF